MLVMRSNEVTDLNRPETFFKSLIQKDSNRKWAISGTVAGLHQFEQSYSDLFRTGVQYGFKFPVQFAKLIPYWFSKNDAEFLPLLTGFRYGLGMQINNSNFETISEVSWAFQPEFPSSGIQLEIQMCNFVESGCDLLNSIISQIDLRPRFGITLEDVSQVGLMLRLPIWIKRLGILGTISYLLERFFHQANEDKSELMI